MNDFEVYLLISKGRGNFMKKEPKLVLTGRTRSLFNTGTRPHKSPKDYTRKLKHKETTSDDGN